VRKVFLGPLAPRRPWHQIVPNYSQRQDTVNIQDKKVTSSCPASSRWHQDVTYTPK